jgi:hypothetical protein
MAIRPGYAVVYPVLMILRNISTSVIALEYSLSAPYRWSRCGKLAAAVTQDMMCEPFILDKTGLSVERHQEITIQRYQKIVGGTDAYIMPVI